MYFLNKIYSLVIIKIEISKIIEYLISEFILDLLRIFNLKIGFILRADMGGGLPHGDVCTRHVMTYVCPCMCACVRVCASVCAQVCTCARVLRVCAHMCD